MSIHIGRIGLAVIAVACLAPIYSRGQDLTERLSPLASLLGHFEVVTFTEDTDGKMSSGPVSQANIGTIHGGAFIREQVKYKSPGGDLDIVTYIGYDSRIGKFKLCAMDKQFQSMDIYHGQFEGKSLVFTNLNSDQPFQFGGGAEVHFKLTYIFTDNGFEHLVEGTADRGITWFNFNRSTYKRIK
ncbi:MAG TPA: DUF1579 family protein [Cyclobacteriaceae bacterium]|nr:DUF1579 family protein [Cyclobacteriaceae bacterium]